MKAFEEKMALRNKEKPQGQLPVVENEDKGKPKQRKPERAEKPQKNQEESLGRDFSFDEAAQFEPVQKFTKNSEKPAQF